MGSVLPEEEYEKQLKEKVSYCEKVIRAYLPCKEGYASLVIEAMNYSVLAGGKRLRPLLLHESGRLYGVRDTLSEPFMAAIEMIHTYSLVHDDLPAMDNDTLRRGKKTTWAVYGDGMALLAGDGLLNFAYETAMKSFDAAKGEQEFHAVLCALGILARNAGIYGMVGGQCADLLTGGHAQDIQKEELQFIEEKKTACMIESSLLCGAALGDAPQEDRTVLKKVGEDLGLSFQIQDDILDVTGCKETLGKSIGKDEKEGKITYVSYYGLDQAKEKVKELSEEAADSLGQLSRKSSFLQELVMHLMTRTR